MIASKVDGSQGWQPPAEVGLGSACVALPRGRSRRWRLPIGLTTCTNTTQHSFGATKQLSRWPTCVQHRLVVVRLIPRSRSRGNTKGVVVCCAPPLNQPRGRYCMHCMKTLDPQTWIPQTSLTTTPLPGYSSETMDEQPESSHGEFGHVAADYDAPSSGQPLSNSWRDEPLTPNESSKVTEILRACKNNDRQQLVALATTSGGLIEDHVRRIACT